MPKVIFYGSCQARAIATLLADVFPGADVILNYTYMLEKKPLPEELYQADILIYQLYKPVNPDHLDYDTDLIVERMRRTNPSARLVCLPFLSFYGYWPDHTLDPRNAATISDKNVYGLFPQQSSVLSKCVSEDQVHDALNTKYSADEVMTRMRNTLDKMKESEKRCDVVIHDFIEKNYAKELLFYSLPHPANSVLIHVAEQILACLGIAGEPNRSTHELLADHEVLILPEIQTILGFETLKSSYKLIDGRVVDAEEYAKEYFKAICDQ